MTDNSLICFQYVCRPWSASALCLSMRALASKKASFLDSISTLILANVSVCLDLEIHGKKNNEVIFKYICEGSTLNAVHSCSTVSSDPCTITTRRMQSMIFILVRSCLCCWCLNCDYLVVLGKTRNSGQCWLFSANNLFVCTSVLVRLECQIMIHRISTSSLSWLVGQQTIC